VNNNSLAWTAVVVYAVLIFIGSSIPGDRLGITNGLDKILHATEYLLFSGLLFRAMRLTLPTKTTKVFWIAAVTASLYGVTDEVHQILVPFRQFDILDISCDVSGSMLGSYLLFLMWNNGRAGPFNP
jgi:VanZ family protein